MRNLARFVAVLVVAGLTAGAVPAAADDAADKNNPAIQMFDNFFLSLVAARLCDNPDERTMNMFTRNLLIVQQLAINYFKTELPGKSTEDIFAILNKRAMALDQGIKATIAEKGCADPDVINLVHLFDIQAHMDLLNEGQKK